MCQAAPAERPLPRWVVPRKQPSFTRSELVSNCGASEEGKKFRKNQALSATRLEEALDKDAHVCVCALVCADLCL